MKNIVLLVAFWLCTVCAVAQNVVITHKNGYVEKYNVSDITESIFTAKSKVCPEYGNYDYVDLGLSVKWANCNLGAKNPWDMGLYFAWGELSDKDGYRSDNSMTAGQAITWDLKQHDAASQIMKGNWRVPTIEEIQELCEKCNTEKIVFNGVSCMKFTSKIPGYEDRYIILPYTGYCTGPYRLFGGVNGYYWSSTPASVPTNTFARCLSITDNGIDPNYEYLRHCGFTIRPVIQ